MYVIEILFINLSVMLQRHKVIHFKIEMKIVVSYQQALKLLLLTITTVPQSYIYSVSTHSEPLT